MFGRMRNIRPYGEMLEQRKSNDDELNDLLIDALEKDQTSLVVQLLDRGADIDARNDIGWSPLHFAAFRMSMNLLMILLERGCDVNARDKQGRTPIFVPITRMLLPMRNMESLHDTVSFFIFNGADVDATDLEGNTPLALAVERANTTMHREIIDVFTQISRELLNGGANPFRAFKNTDEILKFFDRDLSWWENPPELVMKAKRSVKIFGR
jgi:ankyrin repeat protein